MHELFSEFMTLAKEVRRITEMLELRNNAEDTKISAEEAAETALAEYTKLYQKRAPMLAKLSKFVEMLDFEQLEESQKERARETLNAVIEADKELAEQVQQLNLSLRGEMQSIDSAKKLTTGYTHPTELEAQVGGSFDTRQ